MYKIICSNCGGLIIPNKKRTNMTNPEFDDLFFKNLKTDEIYRQILSPVIHDNLEITLGPHYCWVCHLRRP